MKKIKLNKQNSFSVITLNPERSFFKLIGFKISSLSVDNQVDILKDIQNVKISIQTYIGTSKTEHPDILLNYLYPSRNRDITFSNYEGTSIASSDWDKVVFNYINTNDEDLELEVYFETKHNYISVDNPFILFKKHLEEKDNVKILFSAPFGQGKSTFLEIFFNERNKEKYNVFNLFPVNYAVSHNEDIFKYIKAEIFVKLLETSTFDKTTFEKIDTSYFYVQNNAFDLLSPLMKLLPKIGESVYELVSKLQEFNSKFLEYHEEIQIDDAKEVSNFIGKLGEKEGSIFEDNFYTQLIRQQLAKLKSETKKENVLIIDDLDRMDPDHIFRILNVFAAHFDSPYNTELSNKFGFDKIILVGDYYNLKNIFEYRYGPNVGFDGYINKYYSKNVFEYDNNKAIASIINNMTFKFKIQNKFLSYQLLTVVLNDLLECNCISLRELIKLQNQDIVLILSGKHSNLQGNKNYYSLLPYFNLIKLLLNQFDSELLIKKFKECVNVSNYEGVNYHAFTELGFASLVEIGNAFFDKNQFKCIFKGVNYDFNGKEENGFRDGIGYYYVENLKLLDVPTNSYLDPKFNKNDFYEMLIANVEKYKKVGGFS